MKIVDMHSHSSFSFDGKQTVFELCQSAIQKGVYAQGITEHYDLDAQGGTEHYEKHQAERLAEMALAKEKYRGSLRLLCGIEIGQPHIKPEAVRDFLAKNAFDVVIASLHNLRGDVDIGYMETPNIAAVDDMMERSVKEYQELIKNCDADIFGHYDYPMRYLKPQAQAFFKDKSFSRYRDLFRPFLKELAQSGIALEVNTNSARRWIDRPGIEQWTLEDFKSFGGENISVGSDAHRSSDVASHVEIAYEMIAKAGFKAVVIFEKRRAEHIPII